MNRRQTKAVAGLAAVAMAAGASLADTVTITTDTETTAGYSGTAGNPLVVNFAGGALVPNFTSKLSLFGDYTTIAGIHGNDIVVSPDVANVNNSWRGFNFGGTGNATAGDCDLVFRGADNPGPWNSNSDVKSMAVMTGPVTWGHTGDIVVENMRLRVQGTKADMLDVLPYGPGHGGLKVSTRSSALAQYGAVGLLDLYQRSQSINWLDASDGGMVTNCLSSSAQVATLTFGRGDVVGYAKGPIGGNLHVVKTGSAAFALHDTSMPDLTVEDGSISVVGSASVGPLAVKTGVPVTVADGGTLCVSSLAASLTPVTDESAYYFGRTEGVVQDGSIAKAVGLAGADEDVAVSIAAGGTLKLAAAADASIERVSIANAGTLLKTGSGAVTICGLGGQTLGGKVHVGDGSLAFAGVGNTNEWWKFVVTRVSNANGFLHFGQFGLFDKDGNKLWTSISAAADASVPALANGKASYFSAWTYNGTPAKMFTGNWYDYVEVSGLAAQQDQSANPFEVAFRLPAGAHPAAYFAFSATDGYGPAAFHVECSPTGADGTWQTVGSGTWSPSAKWHYWIGDGSWGGVCGMPWKIAANTPASVCVAGTTLCVDSGATLDLAGMTGDIAGIEIDWTSRGGTISGLAVPQSGTLALVNVPDGVNVCDTVLATLPGCEGRSNFRSWGVTVNDATKTYRISVDANDSLALGADATVLIVH